MVDSFTLPFAKVLQRAKSRWDRDRELPLSIRLEKASEYATSLACAKWYLRNVTEVGAGVRTIHCPRIQNHGTMQIGRATILRSVLVPVELATRFGAMLRIGERCSINYGVSIGAAKHIELGNRVRIGPYSMIIDCQFHDVYDRDRCPEPQPVVIEDDVWIGSRVSVMPGVRIGRGSIVGAHAVVTSDVPQFTIVAGVPARVTGQLDASRFVVRNL
jgi:maltose O-acetyltransferase